MLYILYNDFEWDPNKARLNERKHGVSFTQAALVFSDPEVLIEKNQAEGDEQRWQAIGRPDAAAVLLVVHCYREDQNGIEKTRIISARPANKREFQRYFAQP